jgi:hypothetical protein
MGLLLAKEYNETFEEKHDVSKIDVQCGGRKSALELKPGSNLFFSDHANLVLRFINKGRHDVIELTYTGHARTVPILEESVLHFYIVEKSTAEFDIHTTEYPYSDTIHSVRISMMDHRYVELMNKDFVRLYTAKC